MADGLRDDCGVVKPGELSRDFVRARFGCSGDMVSESSESRYSSAMAGVPALADAAPAAASIAGAIAGAFGSRAFPAPLP